MSTLNGWFARAVKLLPTGAQPYAKFIFAVVASVVLALTLFWPGAPSWLSAVLLVLNAGGVYALPNVKAEGP